MRAIFAIAGLLAVVAVIGVLARNQLSAGVAPPTSGASGEAAAAFPPGQQVRQFEQAVQGAMQQARPLPDDDQ